MNDTTAIVISFLRPAYTVGCIKSMRKIYPDIRIIVGENGKHEQSVADACDEVGADYIQLPFDCGVGAARNALMKLVETPYMMVGDDDFFYDEHTGVERMHTFLESRQEFDLIGGRVREKGIVRDYQGTIHHEGRGIVSRPIDLDADMPVDEESGFKYCPADLVFNFFIARTDRVKDIPWDEEIKVAYEHEAWFIDLQEKDIKVAFSPDPIVEHKPMDLRQEFEKSETFNEYAAFRNRKSDKERFFKRHNIEWIIDMCGRKDFAPESPMTIRTNEIKQVDFLITTFIRKKALERLLFSIAEFYPMANVYVADQNKRFDREYYRDLRTRLMEHGMTKRLSVDHIGYDVGVSFARNYLVQNSPNKYKLILDDDFVFTKQTDIGKFVYLLNAFPAAGVVGGLVKQNDSEVHYEFKLDIEGDTIVQLPDDKESFRMLNRAGGDPVKYRGTGCVLNFALFRSDVFHHIRWDDDLKVSEHTDFYLRWRHIPYRILYTPDVVVDHPSVEREEEYREKRGRQEFIQMMFRKHGVRRMRYLNGQIHEAMPDGSIRRYKQA